MLSINTLIYRWGALSWCAHRLFLQSVHPCPTIRKRTSPEGAGLLPLSPGHRLPDDWQFHSFWIKCNVLWTLHRWTQCFGRCAAFAENVVKRTAFLWIYAIKIGKHFPSFLIFRRDSLLVHKWFDFPIGI